MCIVFDVLFCIWGVAGDITIICYMYFDCLQFYEFHIYLCMHEYTEYMYEYTICQQLYIGYPLISMIKYSNEIYSFSF